MNDLSISRAFNHSGCVDFLRWLNIADTSACRFTTSQRLSHSVPHSTHTVPTHTVSHSTHIPLYFEEISSYLLQLNLMNHGTGSSMIKSIFHESLGADVSSDKLAWLNKYARYGDWPWFSEQVAMHGCCICECKDPLRHRYIRH